MATTKTKEKAKVTKTTKKGSPLLVTTEHRGVFFGYGTRTDADTIELTDARMAVYWTSNLKGVLGLAAQGPSSGCRISPSVPVLTLRAVTSVTECSPEAAKAWEKAPWNN